jgi:hypothetical protein
MTRKKRTKVRPPALVATVTLPADDYRHMQAMAKAARRAYDVLNGEHVTHDDISEVAWTLWRAIEGGVPPELH